MARKNNKIDPVTPLSEFYRVHEVAELLGVHKNTVIRWEREGLIKPAKRDYRNWRVYTEEDIKEIKEKLGLGIFKDPSNK